MSWAVEASRPRSKSAERRPMKATPPRRMSGGKEVNGRRPGAPPGAWRDVHGVARQILAAAPQEVVRINLQQPTSLFSPSQSSAGGFERR